jgi:small subunit ribosomal protein S3
MRKAVEESLRFGAQGIKVKVSGRLNGAEIARSEWHLQGSCRCTSAFGRRLWICGGAHTFGVIGVKVWIYRGVILDANAAMARGTGTIRLTIRVDRSARRTSATPAPAPGQTRKAGEIGFRSQI